MGWMTHKKTLFDYVFVYPLLFCWWALTFVTAWLKERVINGDVHWNASSYERSLYDKKTGRMWCRCRTCRRVHET